MAQPENPFLQPPGTPPVHDTTLPKVVEANRAQEVTPKPPLSQPVEGRAVHSRAGRIALPQKGDVFENPQTGERQVVEGVRKDSGETMIMFTPEIEPGVRREPGKAMKQLPLQNFNIQRKVGEFTEFHSIEYNDIFNDCTDVFEAVNRAYESQGENPSPESKEFMDRIGELAKTVSEIDDIWDIIGNQADENGVVERKRELIDRLKAVVAEFPKELVKPYPVLQRVQAEMERKDLTKQDEHDIEDHHSKVKKPKKRNFKETEDGQDGKGSNRGKKSRLQTDVAGVDRPESQQTVDQKFSGRQERVIPETIDPEFLRGTVQEKFVKYGLSQKEWGEDWGDDERHSLEEWVAAIRFAQQDLTDLVSEMRHVRRIRRWEQAMDSLSPEYPDFAQSENGDVVAKHLSEIEGGLASLASGSAEWSDYVTQHRPELRTILFQYLDILRAGVYVLAQAKQHLPDSMGEAGYDQKRKDSDQKAKQSRRERGHSLQRDDDSFSEAASRESTERPREGGVESEEENAELLHWIGGIRQQLHDLDQLASKIFRKKRTTEFKDALFAVSTDHEAFARTKKVKEVSGELEDIEDSLSAKRHWKSQEEYDEWFASKVVRLQEYARIYDEILRTGERVLDAKPGRTSVQREGDRRIDQDTVIGMSQTERALQTVGPTYANLEPGVQQELLKGLERIADATRAIVERANAALLANGITDPDKRREVIVRQFGSKVEQGMRGIVTHAGFTPKEIGRLTRTLLIAGPKKGSDTQV